MNADIPEHEVIVEYYDADYPSRTLGSYPENFDGTTGHQGIRDDVERYREIAGSAGAARVLEACCGTGRVAVPLAGDGLHVTAVDVSAAMLARLRAALATSPRAVSERITLVEQDVCRLDLAGGDFDLAILAFNSLLCITEFDAQCRALERIAAHLRPGALLVVDCVNPLPMSTAATPVPTPFFTRRHPDSGLTYTRFAMKGAFDATQRQRLYGWYDQELQDGTVRRRHYSMQWRPIYRYELRLMLERAGFEVASVEGGHHGEPFEAGSPHMFTVATKSG